MNQRPKQVRIIVLQRFKPLRQGVARIIVLEEIGHKVQELGVPRLLEVIALKCFVVFERNSDGEYKA